MAPFTAADKAIKSHFGFLTTMKNAAGICNNNIYLISKKLWWGLDNKNSSNTSVPYYIYCQNAVIPFCLEISHSKGRQSHFHSVNNTLCKVSSRISMLFCIICTVSFIQFVSLNKR